MTGKSVGIAVWIAQGGRALMLGTGLLGALALATTPAQAAPIRSYALHHHIRSGQSTEAFFQQALNNQWLRIDVPVSVRGLRASAAGLLPDTSFVTYLRWRRSLSPTRFDRYHPYIGPAILRDEILRASLTPTPIVEPARVPQVGGETVGPPPQVPEPGTAAMALAMIGSATMARRWARKQQA